MHCAWGEANVGEIMVEARGVELLATLETRNLHILNDASNAENGHFSTICDVSVTWELEPCDVYLRWKRTKQLEGEDSRAPCKSKGLTKVSPFTVTTWFLLFRDALINAIGYVLRDTKCDPGAVSCSLARGDYNNSRLVSEHAGDAVVT
jgi:hypothetical protein